MGSIGIGELLIIALIGLVVLAIPIGVFVAIWVTQRKKS
jgi:hypothetical protein